MSLIPNDAGIRMRLQTDEALRPLVPITEISVDLSDLPTGKSFSARIQEVLPENTYKALVAGRSLTLALPEGAKVGDTLELVVVDRTARTIIAQLANPEGSAPEVASDLHQFTTLSKTAQLIGGLLTRDGESPSPAILNKGLPLLPRGPSNGAELLPQLNKAVSQSGMFYEAHQAQWALGQRPLADLLVEPQGRHSTTETLSAYRQETNTIGQSSRRLPTEVPPTSTSVLHSLFVPDERGAAAPNQTNTMSPTTDRINPMPEELRPLVQQQLDAAATQRMAWHGEFWPEQKVEWEIERDAKQSSSSDDDQPGWTTSLRLTTPRLGRIDARLRLSDLGVQISIATPFGATAADLRESSATLQQSMEAAGVPLLGLQIRHDAGS